MEWIGHVIDLFVHLDQHLNQLAETMGVWLYLLLFLIIFCETGLVVTPILPGDSLLFAAGALAAVADSVLSVPWLLALLFAAAVLGDAVNYWIGHYVGPRVFASTTSRLLNRKHLVRTQEFYDRHGGKTIILARFIPIIRTFAPFVAGIGRMQYRRFLVYNVVGGAAWVAGFLLAGYYFGELPMVKRNFHIVIAAILVISVMPIVFEYLASRRRLRQTPPPPAPDEPRQ